MTTLNDLVIRTRRRALSDMREETDTLGLALPINANTISLGTGQQLGSIRAGTILEVDYELFYVTAANSPTNISVIPGYLDSVSASHSVGTFVNVNPRFPARDIIDAINEELDSYSSPSNGMFQMKEVSLTWNPVIVGYDFTGVNPDNIIEVWEVRAHEYGPYQAWPLVEPSLYKVERNADPSIFPSQASLKIYKGLYPGRPVRVQYKAPYSTPLTYAGDDVKLVTGLHREAHDIPVIGAACRLMEWRELKRSFTEAQGEPRRAQEVPVGSSLTAVKGLRAQRQMRLQEEAARLARMFPRQAR